MGKQQRGGKGMAGRKPAGSAHAGKYGGSEEAKKRLEVILKTLAGEMTIPEACKTLGIKEAMFHRVRDQAIMGAGEALEAKKPGRKKDPKKEKDEEMEALKRENLMLKGMLRGQQIRERLAVLMPHILKNAEEYQKKTPEPELDLFPDGRWRADRKGTGGKRKKR